MGLQTLSRMFTTVLEEGPVRVTDKDTFLKLLFTNP